MRITDDLDRIIKYNPILDTEVDIDAPYIDFNYAEDSEGLKVEIPEHDINNTLYYNNDKIMIEQEVTDMEVRFYSSTTPNEAYRTGYRHVKGKVLSIERYSDSIASNDGYEIIFDTSTRYNGKTTKLSLSRSYAEITRARCILFIFYDKETGKKKSELTISIDDWFSSKVYMNIAFIQDEAEEFIFSIGDIVDVEFYKKIEIVDYDEKYVEKFVVEKKSYTGRIDSFTPMAREWTEMDENGLTRPRTKYYYMITFDNSEQYDYNKFTIASTVITQMIIHREDKDPNP